MLDRYYPEIAPETLLPLRSAFDQMLNDPLWLERPDCPYDEDTAKALKALWALPIPAKAKVRAQPAAPPKEGVARWEDLSSETATLYEELRQLKDEISTAELKDKLTYMKAATSLVEKMINIGERTANLREYSVFQSRVLAVFDTVLSPEQRTEAMRMLGQ